MVQFHLSDSQDRAFFEIEATIHPEVIRNALTSRSGCLWAMLRCVGFLALLYLALGYELAATRYFPEPGFHPVVLLLALSALHAKIGWPLGLAILCGVLLDAGEALPIGGYACILVTATGAAAIPARLPEFHRLNRWCKAAVAGVLANLVFTLGQLLFLPGYRLADFPYAVCLSTLLAGVAYMPVLQLLFGAREKHAA